MNVQRKFSTEIKMEEDNQKLLFYHQYVRPDPTIESSEIESHDSVLKKPKIKKKHMLSTLDILISITVVSPCAVGLWRAVWELMNLYPHLFPPLESFVFGALVHLIFAIFQDALNDTFGRKTTSTLKHIIDLFIIKIYIYVFAVTSIAHWRAGWILLDRILDVQVGEDERLVFEGNQPIMLFTLGVLICLVALKVVNNCYAPPFVIYMDKRENMFTITTRFKTKMNEQASLYILDCLFSVLVIGTLVVFVWRGAWGLLDIFLFPDDEILSAWGSLILGYAFVAVAFLLQPLMRWLCDRLNGIPRLVVADIYLIMALIGTVNVWRGIWNLLNIYFLPDNMELSCWITHWVCLTVLILLGCSNSLLVRGVYIDAEEPAGKCVVFPCHYLRLIFQGQKNRIKITTPAETVEKSNNKAELVSVKPIENNHVVHVHIPTSDQKINYNKNKEEV